MGVIGIHRCYGKKLIAFPVANAEDEVVGMHGRTIGRPGQTKDCKPWVYDRTGVKSATLDTVGESHAVEVFHHQEVHTAGLFGVVGGDEMTMVESGRRLRFPAKAF